MDRDKSGGACARCGCPTVDDPLPAAIDRARVGGLQRNLSGMDATRHCAPAPLRRQHRPPDPLSHSEAMSVLGRLMSRVHTGDPEAFRALMQAVTAQVAVYRQWGGPCSDPEDMEQELWLALWNALQQGLPQVLSPDGDPERSAL